MSTLTLNTFYCPLASTPQEISIGVHDLDWCVKHGRSMRMTDIATAYNFLELRMAERAALIAETLQEFIAIKAAQNRANYILKGGK